MLKRVESSLRGSIRVNGRTVVQGITRPSALRHCLKQITAQVRPDETFVVYACRNTQVFMRADDYLLSKPAALHP